MDTGEATKLQSPAASSCLHHSQPHYLNPLVFGVLHVWPTRMVTSGLLVDLDDHCCHQRYFVRFDNARCVHAYQSQTAAHMKLS